MLKFGVLLSLSVAAVAATVLPGPAAQAGVSTAAAARHGILPPRNPAASLWPVPDFLASCPQGGDGTACNRLVLAAIARARRALEKMGGMSFSLATYEKLTPDQQLFVTVDLERTERGLPPVLVLSKSLDAIAQAGARAGRDPAIADVPGRLPGGGQTAYVGANWAGGWVSPLGSDYGWMYDDGPGGDNEDCGAAGSARCWGHRDIILTEFGSRSCDGGQTALAMGAGHATRPDYGESDTEILAGVCGPTPTDAVFTWTEAEKLLHIG
jgi:hypothetical protein